MNNILKKNIIRKEEMASTTLPHTEQFDVAVKTNQIVYAALNYALQKLVDNDLYIEKKLIYESNYTEGPLNKDSVDISLVDDNIKLFDGIDGIDNNLSIVQKIPYDLTATIKNTLELSVQYIHDGICYFATTSYGIYKSTDNMHTWTKLTEVDNIPTNYSAQYLQNNHENIIFTTPDAVYKIDALEGLVNTELAQPSCLQIFDKCANIKNNIAVLNENTLFIGNSKGLYTTSQLDENKKYINPIKENTIRSNVTDISFLSSNNGKDTVVVGTSGTVPGLYISQNQYSFYNIKNINLVNGIQYSTVIDNVLYTAGNFGLSCLDTANQCKSFYQLQNNKINKLVKAQSSSTGETVSGLYACTTTGIWKINPAEMTATKVLENNFGNKNIVDVCHIDDKTIVATPSSIHWAVCEIDNVSDADWHTKSFNETVKGIVQHNDSFSIYTTNTIYAMDIDVQYSSHSEPFLQNVFENKPDITTVYFDDANKVLIGTTAGLFDENFDPIQTEDGIITSYVNKIRYLNIFGKDIWCVCTSSGAYLLQEGNNETSNEIWLLNGLHILPNNNVKDVAYDYASRALAVAADDTLYCLVLPVTDSAYETTNYITTTANYYRSTLDDKIKSLANFNGKIIVFKENNNVSHLELFKNFSGIFEKTKFFEDKQIEDFSRIQTFATNGYAVETYARTAGSSPELYKYVQSVNDEPATFKKIQPSKELITSQNKMEIALAYRYLINPNADTIPKSICMLPNDRYSEIMLVSTNGNMISAYDIADMKIHKYTELINQEPIDIYNRLQLDELNPEDNVKVITASVNNQIKGICYAVNTLKNDVIDQQQNMHGYIATALSVASINTIFNCNESLRFKGLDPKNGEYPEMQQFSLIPYAVKDVANVFSRKYIYIGIAENKLYRYFENIDDAHDFDRGEMENINDVVIDETDLNLREAEFYKYDFSYDEPFNNKMDELKSKYNNTPTSEGSQAKFVLFASNTGLLASVITYGDTSQYGSWFANFTKIPGFDKIKIEVTGSELEEGSEPIEVEEIPCDLCRHGNLFYIATENHIYTLNISNCKLDKTGNKIALNENTKVVRYNGSDGSVSNLEFDSITHIYNIGNDVYVLGNRNGVDCLTRITGQLQTITGSVSTGTNIDIAPVPGTYNALIQVDYNNLSVFDSSNLTFSELSTEMLANILISVEVPKEGSETETETRINNVLSTGKFPCSADSLFTQYDYVKNRSYAYFANAWHKSYNNFLIEEYDQACKMSVDLSGISKYNGIDSEIEFDFNAVLQHDSNGNAVSDDTIAYVGVNSSTTPHSISAIENYTRMYLVRPADEQDDTQNKYGVTYMFFSKGGDIFSGSYGFTVNEIKNQLAAGGVGYNLATLKIPEGHQINCIDAITFETTVFLYKVELNHGKALTQLVDGSTAKNVELADGTTLTVVDGKSGDSVYINSGLLGAPDIQFVWTGNQWKEQQSNTMNISLVAIGTTNGLRIKFPGIADFNTVDIEYNNDIDEIVKNSSVKSLSWSEKSLTFLTDDKKLVNIPYEIDINGNFNFVAENAKFATVSDSFAPTDVFAFDHINTARDVEVDQQIIVSMQTPGVYIPMYNCSTKNEETFAYNVNTLYQHDTGMFLANGNKLSSYEVTANGTQINVFTAQNCINFIYENSQSNKVYYGSGSGVFVLDIQKDNVVETAFDSTANQLLTGKQVESIFRKDNYYCYEIKENGRHDVVKASTQRVTDTIIVNDANEIFSTIQQIFNVYNYNQEQLLAVCNTPMLIDKSTKVAENYKTNIPSQQSVKYINILRRSEYAITDDTLYYRKLNAKMPLFQPVCLDIATNIDDISQINANNIVYIDDKWLVDKQYGIFKYENLDFVRYYKRLTNKSVFTIFKVNENTVLVGASDGLYRYENGIVFHCNVLAKAPVHSISIADTTDMGEITYFLTSGAKVYKTKDFNFMTAELIFDLSTFNSNINRISTVKKFGKKSYVFGTNIGILNTYDKYYLVDNWSKQTTDGISKQIKSNYDVIIQQHIQQEHGKNSIVTQINNDIMPTDMSEMPAEWQTISNNGNTIISNDYVDEVEFNGDINYITAEYSNFTTDYDPTISGYSYQNIGGISYILKKYKSNIKELYIYIPTTGTQYVNHVEGMQYCSNSNYAFVRSNTKTAISGTVADLKTKLRVWLDAEHFSFNEIYNVFINGNSLPLKIFTDKDKHDEGESQQYFHSYMEPSIVNSMPVIAYVNGQKMPLQNMKNGKYFFDFSCFGTDAQSIKIVGKSPYVYTVVFNSNSADRGQMYDLVLKEDQQIKLPTCNFVKDGYIFKGWSLEKNGPIVYVNEQDVVNLATFNNATVTLYANWEYYIFDITTDTTLTLKSTNEEFMLANSEAAVDCSNIIVDYE